MRIFFPITLAALGACGPIAAPPEDVTTSDASTSTGVAVTAPTTTTSTSDVSTTSTSTDASTSTGTTVDSSFIPIPDVGNGSTIDCDVWTQDCPLGQKCAPWAEGGGGSWNALKCVDVTGDGAPGDPCLAPEGGVAGIDDCALGSICWYVDQDGHGFCVAQCTGNAVEPICPAGFSCAIGGESILALCFPECDPLLGDCFPEDELCIPSGEGFNCVPDASGDGGQFNDACETPDACDPGLLCFDPAATASACDLNASGCCTPFCQLPDGPCPNPDQQCLPWFDPMMPVLPGYEDLGFCAIAP